MAYIRVETSVARNKKFVKAGPAPSWLWLCGLAYCQEGLTDGFIPREALPYLGVKNAAQLAAHLVGAGLWHQEADGWRVNDYLKHNKSAVEVAETREKRANGGNLGGRPKVNLRETSKVSSLKTFPVDVDVDASVAVVGSLERGLGKTEPFDVWFDRLKGLYPPHRVTSGHRTVTAFVDALSGAPEGAEGAFGRMLSNLALAKRGHEWRVKGMVPKLENWLATGAWEQIHPEAPPETLITDKTARTMTSAAAFVAGGDDGPR